MRIANAQAELTAFCDDGECVEYEKLMAGVSDDAANDESERVINEKRSKIRAKHDIPDGVHLFYEGMESALTPPSAKNCKPHLAAWVKGKLTKDQCSDIFFYFEEMEQADWGWIMLERPLGYYDAPSDDDMDAIRAEMESIGTRSRSKNTKLPPLTDGSFFK